MLENENLEQIEQTIETACKNDGRKSELKGVLWQEYPKIELSMPNENSRKIRTYLKDSSYFASKGTCRSESSRLYSIQDLVTIETSHYCSPDWRSYWNSIDKINLFPNEKDFPEEFDNTSSDNYWSGQYDYLTYDKENKKIFYYSTGNQLASKDHYFWVSPDSTILFPWIETVQECNWWYFHHIIIDNQSGYKYVDKNSIQETINALFDQKKEMEKLKEYRERYGDIWLELPWTEYSSWYYEPSVYMWDKHWAPAHEYSDERWFTNKLLVKFWKPWDCINFYRWGKRYSVTIDENKEVEILNHTSCRWNNNQDRWYDELWESNIQWWQIFINGEDVYDSTMSRISEKQKESKESRKNKFLELKSKLTDEYKFSESEFQDLCKYAWKWNVIKFLLTIKSMHEWSGIKNQDILDVIMEIKYPGEMIFRNYVLIKKNAKKFTQSDVKRVVEKGYARKYLTDNLPWIWFIWYFEDVIWALKLALGKWLFRNDNFVYVTKSESTISDLWQALINAGVVSK